MGLLARMRVAARLNLAGGVFLAGVLIAAIGGFWGLRDSVLHERAVKSRQMVEAALGIVKTQYNRAQSGEIDTAEAQRQALRALGAMRYGSGNYLWVNDFHVRLLLHPVRSDLVGRDLSDFRDVDGMALFAEFARIGRERGSGYVTYRWPKPGYEAAVDKMSYVAAFAPWEWVIGTGSYGDDAQLLLNSPPMLVGVAGGGLCLLAMLAGWIILQGVLPPLERLSVVARRLSGGDHDVEIPARNQGDELDDLADALTVLRDHQIEVRDLRRQRHEEGQASESQLRRQDELLALIEHCSGEGIVTLDQDGLCQSANRTALELLGCDQPGQLLGRDLAAVIQHSAADGTPHQSRLRRILDGEEVEADDEVFWRIERSCFPVQYHGHPLHDPSGQVVGGLLVFQDIAERRRLDESMRLVRTIFNTTSEGILVCNHQNLISSVNPAFCRITGYDPQDVLGQDPRILESGRHDRAFFAAMWASLRGKGMWEGEIWNRHKNGAISPHWLSISAIRDHGQAIVEYVAVLSDVTMRERDAADQRHRATHDALTDLPNRSHFFDCLERALMRVRATGSGVALLVVDFQNFRAVNQRHGNDVGDRVLQMAAKRLRRLVRESDLVGRVGGDGFMVALDDIGQSQDARDHAATVADKIRHSLGQNFQVDRLELALPVSVGLAFFPNDGGDGPALAAAAEAALQHSCAKELST